MTSDNPDMPADLRDLLTDEGRDGRAAQLYVDCAKLEPLSDGGMATCELLTKALACDPHHHEARILLERLHQMFVPRWHFPMLDDATRNRAYAEAISAKLSPGDIVLDIGCGAGLTAMLAARAGAGHVYTCEEQPLIAQAATRVIAMNGLSDRITVIPKRSQDLVIGVDLPERADLVVSEIVDTVLLGEGALATLDHAMRDLAKPGARAVPEGGRLMAQLVESEKLYSQWRPRSAEGFDLRAFHHFANVAQLTPNDCLACGLRPLGAPHKLFEFDFSAPALAHAKSSETIQASLDGTVHAVLVFFEMWLAPGVTLTNDLTSTGHWGRTAFLLPSPTEVRAGRAFHVVAQHDTSRISLAIEDEEAGSGA